MTNPKTSPLAALLLIGLAIGFGLYASAAQAAGMSVIRDAEIESTLKTYGRQVFEEAGLSPDTVRFVLIQQDTLNAFVAGGQNIFLHTGLILETENPSELLGVIAHETGHIADGHLFRTQAVMDDISLQAILANVLGVAVAIGAGQPQGGMATAAAGSSYAQQLMLRHSRVQESAADQAGVRFLQQAHLPLTGFLSFMRKMSSQELLPESQQNEYVRTHPLTRDRVSFLESVANQPRNRGETPAAWDELHARMKAKLMGFIYPDRALQDKSTSAAAQYGRAIATYRKGKPDAALGLLAPLIKAEPNNPYFQELRGQILFESGRVDDALPAYADAAAHAPQSGLIHLAYGHALMEAKNNQPARLKDAEKQLQLSLRTEPLQPETHHFLAIVYGKQGQEGLSRLHLAEEALLNNKTAIARREAMLAKAALPRNSPSALRVDDILSYVDEKEKNRKKD